MGGRTLTSGAVYAERPAPPASEAGATGIALVEPDVSSLRLSVIIPATDAPVHLERAVAAMVVAEDPPAEIIVVEHPRGASRSAARNSGAARATGDVLVFVDADVEIHSDALVRIREVFRREPDLTALFGSYDDAPADPGVVSAFRNLLHHHVHQRSPGPIGTFWTGLGAIRRRDFECCGGFVECDLEDVELGMRLAESGALIVLDPRVQGKHLKRWTFSSMLRTDLWHRGAPWTELALQHHGVSNDLNLGWRYRLSAIASVVALGSALRRRPGTMLRALAPFVALNGSFYRLLLRRRGPLQATAGIGLHLLHHVSAVAAVPAGVTFWIHTRRQPAALTIASPPAGPSTREADS